MVEDYVRNARLLRVIDGDTFDLDIDLGFRIWFQVRVRLLGVNCPEVTGPTKDAGLRAKTFAAAWLGSYRTIKVRTHLDERDSFGRALAEIEGEDGANLASALLSSGNALPFKAGVVFEGN